MATKHAACAPEYFELLLDLGADPHREDQDERDLLAFICHYASIEHPAPAVEMATLTMDDEASAAHSHRGARHSALYEVAHIHDDEGKTSTRAPPGEPAPAPPPSPPLPPSPPSEPKPSKVLSPMAAAIAGLGRKQAVGSVMSAELGGGGGGQPASRASAVRRDSTSHPLAERRVSGEEGGKARGSTAMEAAKAGRGRSGSTISLSMANLEERASEEGGAEDDSWLDDLEGEDFLEGSTEEEGGEDEPSEEGADDDEPIAHRLRSKQPPAHDKHHQQHVAKHLLGRHVVKMFKLRNTLKPFDVAVEEMKEHFAEHEDDVAQEERWRGKLMRKLGARHAEALGGQRDLKERVDQLDKGLKGLGEKLDLLIAASPKKKKELKFDLTKAAEDLMKAANLDKTDLDGRLVATGKTGRVLKPDMAKFIKLIQAE